MKVILHDGMMARRWETPNGAGEIAILLL